MSDPFESIPSKIMRDLQAREAVTRSAWRTLGPLEQAMQQRQMIADVLPYYDATRKLLGITGALEDRAALSRRAEEMLDSLTPGVPKIQRAMLDLLADRAKLDQAFGTSFYPSFALTDALTKAAASADRSLFQGIAFDSLQETVARSLGMRSFVEEQINVATLRPEVRGIWDGLTGITDAATTVWARLADHSDELMRLPEFLREVPVLQEFEATRSSGLLLVDEPELVEAEPAVGLLVVEAGELVDRLRAIHPDLADAYEGALETFARKGKDYVRQVSVSLRELFVALFRVLAPRESIALWDASVLLAKGDATNKAHLKYIYRGQAALVGYDTLTERDIDHVLQNFYVLNAGVHKLSPELADQQMLALVRRCEYCLLSVLYAHELAADGQ